MRAGRAIVAVLCAAALSLTATAPAAATPRGDASHAGIEAAHAVPAFADDPDDPVREAEYWLDSLGVREAWETTRGAGQTIAIIDTGIGAGPPEFDGAVAGGTDVSGAGTPDGRTPVGALDSNHGSWVASLAAARGTGDGEGMVGVAPEASLLSVSVGFGGAAQTPFVEQVADGIRWAVDNGATVINLSFTTNTLDWDPLWDDAFEYAYDNDVVVVVAAGNRGSGTTRVGAPATIPGVLTVAGVDPDGTASVDASTQGITIGVSAPSEDLLGVSADGRIVRWSGTSGAAPIVAGIAALVRSAHPGADVANVINRLVETAAPAPDQSDRPDPLYGYGIVDAAAAVSGSVPQVTENPMGSLAEWIRIYRRAEVNPEPEQTTEEVVIPELPPREGPTRGDSALLPSEDSLRYGTLPLVATTVAGILVALGVTAAARFARSTRASRTPDRTTAKESPSS
ncbi:S8 family serine peptidase [Microbacterium sp. LRZ72]|uniref:S8 family peptidase n=1 Tax=Microbacterium sp. LRZ72 TaxID=2942481 RepID=UPI0029AD2616|nr:S8 family serine peptidase [Microbacterium sp. LRZ72]MDX2375821.1 S8 family serine peptidase [Microbacterium sp. LRZ72]